MTDGRGGGGAAVVDLRTSLAGIALANPVLVASGCGGSGRELRRFGDLARVGAFVTPSVAREPSAGAPMPRLLETPCGLLYGGGRPGPGIDAFLATELPELLRDDVRTIVSLAGANLGEFAEVSRRVGNTPGITAVEVDLSGVGRPAFAREPVVAGRAVSVVRRDVPPGVPVLAKVWVGADVVAMAAAVLQSGADGVVVSGSQPGLAIDLHRRRPVLGSEVGELCGPAVRPVGLHAVREVRRTLPDATIIGVGGVCTGRDALGYLVAGADAVQVGSALLADPDAALRVVRELAAELAAAGIPTPRAVRSAARLESDTTEEDL